MDRGITYPMVKVDDILPGFCEVDVKLNKNGEISECMMISEPMAMRIEGPSKDVVRPYSAWFMFIKGEEKKPWE
jgi:hypothetical protein